MKQNAILGARAHMAAPPVIYAAISIEDLRARLQELEDEHRSIIASADDEERDLSDEELTRTEAITNERAGLSRQITAREAAAPRPGPGRATRPEAGNSRDPPARSGGNGGVPSTQVRPTVPAEARDGRAGFTSLGEFAHVIHAQVVNGQVDDRLRVYNAALSTYSSEGIGAEGGIAVPPDFRATIMERVFGEASLLGMSDQLTSTSNMISFPIDMTTPWQTTGGLQAYWEAEAAAKTQSKLSLEPVTLRLHKLAAIVPVTDELLEDAPALTGYLNRKVPEKMDFAVSFAMAWGNGVGKPLGWMNSPALVTQAAEGGQTADTINANNIVKMYARMPTSSLSTARWFIHPDAWPQLPLMTIGNQPVYVPPSTGLAGAPFGTLMGRPLFPHQICETVGDLGDIMFVDLQQYLTITKAGGIRQDVSIHLWFDQDATAFRFVLRVAGQPWWSAAVASRDGTFTQSPFVALAAR